MTTSFTEYLGYSQGRITPTNHTSKAADDPQPATLTAINDPYALADGETLLVIVDDGAVQTVTFSAVDFVDIGAATAAEVAAVLTAQLVGATGQDVSGRATIVTSATGTGASLEVVGGLANFALQLPTARTTGTQGVWTMVLGSDIPRTIRAESGDYVRIAQTFDVQDSDRLTLLGAVRWATAPAGYGWRLKVTIEGEDAILPDYESVEAEEPNTYIVATESIDDVGLNLTGLAAPTTATVAIDLELVALSGPAGTTIEVELPAVYIDAVLTPEGIDNVSLLNRYPAPDAVDVHHGLRLVYVDIIDITGIGIDNSATDITIAGVAAVVNGVAQAGFAATVTTVGPANRDRRWEIDISGASFQPLASEANVSIRVESETTGGANTIDETYSFTMADTVQPTLTSAQARGKSTVRLQFDDAMLMDASANGVLNPANYDIITVSAPAVALAVVAATQVSTSAVDLAVTVNELDDDGVLGNATDEMSPGATYTISVGSNVVDTSGNVIDPVGAQTNFVGFYPAVPDGRDFTHWNWLPTLNKSEDATGDLRRFSLIMQDVIDLLLCLIDKWTEIIDVDLAPEEFVDAMLFELGNPFAFIDLAVDDKRRLARILLDIYKSKGTAVGIIDAIRFFVGVEVSLDIVNTRSYWQLGVSLLGNDTLTGPGAGDPAWYTFYILSAVNLTDEQRTQILQIADYMKPAHEHIGALIEPEEITPPTAYWRLGVHLLGTQSLLSQ